MSYVCYSPLVRHTSRWTRPSGGMPRDLQTSKQWSVSVSVLILTKTRSATVRHERLSDWPEVLEQHTPIFSDRDVSVPWPNTTRNTQPGIPQCFRRAHGAYLWLPAVTLLLVLQQAVATLRDPHRGHGGVLQTQTAAVANQHLKVVCTTGAEVGGSSSRSRRGK